MSGEVMTWESACMARNKGIVCDASCEACLIEAELSALAAARAEGFHEGMLKAAEIVAGVWGKQAVGSAASAALFDARAAIHAAAGEAP